MKQPQTRSMSHCESPLKDKKGLEFWRNYLKRLGLNLTKIKEALALETRLKLAH